MDKQKQTIAEKEEFIKKLEKELEETQRSLNEFAKEKKQRDNDQRARELKWV